MINEAGDLKPSRSESALSFVARWLTVSAVVLSVWLFGASDGWAHLIIISLVLIAGICWLLSLSLAPQCRLRLPGMSAALLMLVAYIGIQSLPIGPLANVLNPTAAEWRTSLTSALAPIAGGGTLAPIAKTMSTCPAVSRRAFMLAFSYLLVFLITANTLWTWGQVKRMGAALVISTFVMVVVAIIHKSTGNPKLLWLQLPRYGGQLFGPFTNRNHFAAYVNLVTGLSLGLFLSAGRRLITAPRGELRTAFAELSSERVSRLALLAFCIAMFAGAVCISLSRGGMLSLAIGMVVVFVISLHHNLPRYAQVALVLIVCLMLSSLGWMGWQPVVDRIETLRGVTQTHSGESRFAVTGDTLQIIRDFPLTGCGFGSFRHVYPRYSSRPLDERYLHAHNDWAQFVAEGGGFALLLLGVALWSGGRTLRKMASGASMRLILLLAGLAVSMASIGLHSCFDYALHKPSVAMLLAALVGLAAGSVHAYRQETIDNPDPQCPIPKTRRCSKIITLILILANMVLLIHCRSEWLGELAFIRLLYQDKVVATLGNPVQTRDAIIEGTLESDAVQVQLTTRPEALQDTAGILLEWSQRTELGRPLRTQLLDDARGCATEAVIQAPTDYLGWLWLARAIALQGYWDVAETLRNCAQQLVGTQSEVRLFERPDEHVEFPGATRWEKGWR